MSLQGAYGAAVLYRKKDDNSLVILKEINLMDLSKQERSLALNEVRHRIVWVWPGTHVGVAWDLCGWVWPGCGFYSHHHHWRGTFFM